MPGIIGLINTTGKPLSDDLFPEMLKDLLDPKDAREDIWVSPDRSMAAARLHLGVFNPAPQPVCSPDNSCFLWMDGEIFNEDFDLHDQPRAVLNAYLQEKEELFVRLNGSFSLLIIELKKRTVTLVTDRMATVPFYYAHRGDLFAFGAEIKPLLRVLGSRRRADPEAVEDFLSSGFLLEGRTLVQGVRSIRPGEMLKVENGKVILKRYWNFHFASDRDRLDKQELEDELLRVCKQAVVRRTRDNVISAVPLSGGYDSRALLFFWKSVNPDGELRTVTWGVSEEEPDSDAWVARRLSSLLDTEHRFFPLKAECLPDHFQEFVRRDEGRTDAVGNYPEGLRIFERIRDESGIQVLLRGNEIFGARNRVFREKDTLHTAFIDAFSLFPNSFHYLKPKVYHYLRDIGEERLRRLYASAPYEDPTDRKDYLFINLRVSGYQSPLTQLKRQVIEERNPFFDNDVVDFVSLLPARLRVWKNFFASTMRRRIPGFTGVPFMKKVSLVDWIRCLAEDIHLQDYVNHVLFELGNGLDDIFDRRQLRLFIARAFQRVPKRSLMRRVGGKFRTRLDHYELDADIEIFRLMILKLWVNEFLDGDFSLPI